MAKKSAPKKRGKKAGVARPLVETESNFIPYLETITAELQGIKDRVRRLVRHWPTDGHFKEAVFRKVLRRHLPESVLIGNGFVVNALEPSGEIDILVVDKNMPILFRDDELFIVTPEAVKAVIEVKSRLDGPAEILEAVDDLRKRLEITERHGKKVWGGLFVYEGMEDRHETIVAALLGAYQRFGVIVDFVAFGEDTVVKFFPWSKNPAAQKPLKSWHSFRPCKSFCVRLAGERYLPSVGMRPSNRMAKWLRASFQLRIGIVHFLAAS